MRPLTFTSGMWTTPILLVVAYVFLAASVEVLAAGVDIPRGGIRIDGRRKLLASLASPPPPRSQPPPAPLPSSPFPETRPPTSPPPTNPVVFSSPPPTTPPQATPTPAPTQATAPPPLPTSPPTPTSTITATIIPAAPVQVGAATTPTALSVNITVKSTLDTPSTTSRIIGVNSGHSQASSNSWKWYKRMGANGARRFFNYQDDLRPALGTRFGLSQLGDFNVTSQATLINAINQLRSNASADIKLSLGTATSTFIAWADWVNGPKGLESQNPSPEDGSARAAFDNWKALGIDILGVSKVTCRTASTTYFDFTTFNTSTAAYWAERWELWRWHYAIGVWLHGNGVSNMEILNEPELEPCIRFNSTITPNGYQIWKDHYLIRSQAVRAAFADRNTKPGATVLTPNICGAPFANWQSYANDNFLGQYMIRDNWLAWPQLTYNNTVRNVDRYCYHIYGSTGVNMNAQTIKVVTNISTTVEIKTGGNTTAIAPVDITEYSTHTGGAFNAAPYNTKTLDDPDEMSTLASQILYSTVASKREDRHYVFKFSQDSASQPSGVVKAGLLYGENDAAPYDIGDSNLGGEVFAMIARRMAGSKSSYAMTTSGRDTSQGLGAVDDGTNYYLTFSNAFPNDTSLILILTAWTVPAAGAPVFVNEISNVRTNELAGIVPITTAGTAKTISFRVSAYSVVQFVVPKTTLPIVSTSYAPSGDATIKGGVNSATNFGAAATIDAGFAGSSMTADNTAAAFLQFSGLNLTNMHAAILTLRVKGGGANARNVLTILGLNAAAPAWTQAGITWSTAPAIKPLPTGSTISFIRQNIIDWSNGAATAPDIVGHLTVTPSANNVTLQVDVTDYVKSIGSNPRFIIHRPFRRNAAGTVGDAAYTKADVIADSLVSFESSESTNTAARPSLTIYRH